MCYTPLEPPFHPSIIPTPSPLFTSPPSSPHPKNCALQGELRPPFWISKEKSILIQLGPLPLPWNGSHEYSTYLFFYPNTSQTIYTLDLLPKP
jgi:hypothetical protein